MKRHSSIISLGLVFILWFGVAWRCSCGAPPPGFYSNRNAGSGNANSTNNGASRFVGTWKQAPVAGHESEIESFVINDDGSFVIKPANSRNEEVHGTFALNGDKLTLIAPKFTEHHDSPEVTIGADGRLKMLLNKEDRRGMYFVKK